MRRVLYIVLFFVCFQQVALSQPGNTKVEALRVAFISKRLELSTAEAEKFWPIYNEYIDKIQAAKKNLRQAYKRRVEPLSDADAEELYKLEAQTRQAEADLFKTYNERLKTIIGVKKMVKLRIAEDEFKRELIKTIKEGGE